MPKELNTEQINSLVSAKPRSGEYKRIMQDFVDSDSQGADYTEDFPGRKLESVANSFKRIQKKHDEFAGVQVIYVSRYSDNPETLALVKS